MFKNNAAVTIELIASLFFRLLGVAIDLPILFVNGVLMEFVSDKFILSQCRASNLDQNTII